MKEHLSQTLAEIREAGLYKEERLIESPQRAAIQVKGKEVLNFVPTTIWACRTIPGSSKPRSA